MSQPPSAKRLRAPGATGRPIENPLAGLEVAESTAPVVDRRLATITLIILLGNALSRILGLVREQVLASRFGTGEEIAAYTIADNVQNMLFELTTNGVLQAALIPTLAALAVATSGGISDVRRAVGALLGITIVVTGSLAAIGTFAAPTIVWVMTTLFGENSGHSPATHALTIELVRWLLPAVPLLALGTVMMAALHAVGRPLTPSLSSATRNFIFIMAAVTLTGILGPRAMALGTVLGAIAIILIQLPELKRAGLLTWPHLDLTHPSIRTVMLLSAPVMAGLAITTAIGIVDRNLAWNAGEDALGAMRYATTLVQTILGLIAAAVSLAALPSLSRYYEAGNRDAFVDTVRKALTLVTLLILPATVGLAAIAEPVVSLLFGHGATDPEGARAITDALWGYLPGTLAAGYAQVLTFAFYAQRNTKTPLLITGVSAIVYLVVAFALVGPLGMVGLVLANSAQWLTTMCLALALGWNRLGFAQAVPWPLIVNATVGAVASAMMAWSSYRLLFSALEAPAYPTLGQEIVLVAGPALLGGLTYVFAMWPELIDLVVRLRARRAPVTTADSD